MDYTSVPPYVKSRARGRGRISSLKTPVGIEFLRAAGIITTTDHNLFPHQTGRNHNGTYVLKKISQITVPNDIAYVSGAVAYAAEVCQKCGFTSREVKEIKTALEEAMKNVIVHAFDPYEDESFTVTFTIIEDGISIEIDEMGMPFETLPGEPGGIPGIHVLEENMDDVVFVNQGRRGKELRLVKYMKGAHVRELFTDEELRPYEYCEVPDREIDFTIRLMKPEESVQVSRCIYRTYRYTYLNEDLYFPERIESRNRDGRMISAVAVLNTPDTAEPGEVIAHFALLPRPNGRVAEIGIAVVQPKYRGRGLMKRLLEFIMDVAEERGFLALYGNAFTMHDLSQRTNLKYGFHETALQLGGIPPGSIKPLTDRGLAGAGNVMTFFKYLRGVKSYAVYVPPRHKHFIEEIYGGLGIERNFGLPGNGSAQAPEESVLTLAIKPYHRTAVIGVEVVGADLDRRVKAKRMELGDKGFNTIFLDLKLTDPATPDASGRLESIGFFFAGLLPDYGDGDILRLQYYMTEVYYDEIEAYSEFAVRLKDYVRSLDPKWKALH